MMQGAYNVKLPKHVQVGYSITSVFGRVSNPRYEFTFRNYINELEFNSETFVKVQRIVRETGSILGEKAERE